MRKLTARWVLKSLSDEQMATRASVCSALLKRFRSKDDFLLRLVTVDETWIHYYEPENKAQSSVGRAWVPEAKEVQDTIICWQCDGHSILGRKRRYYVGLFTQEKYNNWSVLCKLVRLAESHHSWKTPLGKLSKGVLLQQDNARVHTCKGAMDAIERNGYELIPHPAYFPDLAPSDFFLFPNLKRDIRGLHSRSDEEVVTAVQEWVNGMTLKLSVLGWWHLNTVGLSASH